MNLLDLVPAFKRQLGNYVNSDHTDSTLAAYLADAIDALNWRWTRTYEVTTTTPNTYEVEPEITAKDKRAVILMAAIIYKGAIINFAKFTDGDFAYDPQISTYNPLNGDIAQLDLIVPLSTKRLAKAMTAPLRGYSNGYNPEGYGWLPALVAGAFYR